MSNRFLTLNNGAFTSTPFSPRHQALENFTAAGVPLYPAGAGSIPVIGTPDQVRAAIVAEPVTDNYVKGNYSITTGGTSTDERWIFIPVYTDNYTRITISRGYNDNSYAFGALSAVIKCTVGAWGSSGGGSYLNVLKANEFAWTGAFAGATAHLLREVRLLESSGAEVAYSGLWIRVMGARTYKIAGSPGQPIEYASYVPTIGSLLAVLTPPGAQDIHRGQSNFESPYRGVDLQLATISALTATGIVTSTNPAEATSTTTGGFQMPGIGMGNGAIAVGKRVQFTPVSAASQPNLSLFVDSATGKLSFKDSAGTVNVLY